MGGSQSTRKISIDSDEAVGVIRVSENVAQRLKNINNNDGGKGNATVPNTQPQVPVNNQNVNIYQQHSDGVYIPQPYITSTMVRQQIEKELEQNDQYWEKRIKTLKDNQSQITHILESEFNKAYKEAENKFPKITKSNAVPCQDLKSKIVDCYKNNANHTLNCSSLVNEFTTCISDSRSKQDSKTRSP